MMNEFLARLSDTLLFGLQLFAELAVLFVLISFLVGVLNEWLPEEKTRRWLSARHGHGYLIGALIGSVTPFCSCSTVPLTMGLLKSGAGFGPTMTLLFTSPLVNPIIIALFWVTFGLELTLLYAAMAIGAAILVAWSMDRAGFERFLEQGLFDHRTAAAVPVPLTIDGKGVDEAACCAPQAAAVQACCTANPEPVAVGLPTTAPAMGVPVTGGRRTGRAAHLFREAVGQFRSFLPHIAIGVGIGAVAHGFVPDELLVRYAGPDNLLAIPVAALIGVPLYVRGSTMIPIALTLTAKGMGIGAVIALVIGGAGASLPEVVMLKRMFRWPILVVFLFSVFGIAITTGYLAEWLF
ncbi:MAG TPA: permease [Sedimenticola thiotaurini]|uniref:Permease n=1 Tax=Sedimenticola thiotaurini TaxID=1543721 RepID=A0A831RJV0_9GAMM|nr:permease [Sedimenticola thiotaurini]